MTPIVRMLGNLCAGPESVGVALVLVRHPDFPAILTSLLSTNYLSLAQVIRLKQFTHTRSVISGFTSKTDVQQLFIYKSVKQKS